MEELSSKLFVQLKEVGDYVPVCESEASFKYAKLTKNRQECQGLYQLLEEYLKLTNPDFSSYLQHNIPNIRTERLSKPIVAPHSTHSVLYGLMEAWREDGWKGIEQYVEKISVPPYLHDRSFIIKPLQTLIYLIDRVNEGSKTIGNLISPFSNATTDEAIENSSEVIGWKSSWIKFLKWHSSYPRFAIGLQDDSVRVVTVGSDMSSVLRSHKQKSLTCASWRPYLANELAVGVEKGVLIWKLDSPLPKVGNYCFDLLDTEEPVITIEYAANSVYLLACCTNSRKIHIWHVDTRERVALFGYFGGFVTRAIWSPDSRKIACTTNSSAFRIWDKMKNWSAEEWKTVGEPVDACCWSPCGELFIFSSDNVLYSISFASNPVSNLNQKKREAVAIFDLSFMLIERRNAPPLSTGGRVRRIVWDPTGNRIAISFDDTNCIQVFRVQMYGRDFLSPIGFIYGHPDEYPVAIDFQKDYDDGALLTIAWSSKRLQYFPMLFIDPNQNKDMKSLNYLKRGQNLYRLSELQLLSQTQGREQRSSSQNTGDNDSDYRMDDEEDKTDDEFELLELDGSINEVKVFSSPTN